MTVRTKRERVCVDPVVSSAPEFFSSGCGLLDLALGGGWAEERVANIIGDSSTGKTLLAIEAIANYCQKYTGDEAMVYYRETESAFDTQYAQRLGLPLDRVNFCPKYKVENSEQPGYGLPSCAHTGELQSFMEGVIAHKGDKRALVIVDSLDAMGSDPDESLAYGGSTPKDLSRFFSSGKSGCDAQSVSGVTMIFISQIRAKMVTMGRKTGRSGGKALTFYCSQVVWLTRTAKRVKKFKRKRENTSKEVERVVGFNLQVEIEKNKVGTPFHKVNVPLLFGYGLEPCEAALNWLDDNGFPFWQYESKIKARNALSKLSEGDYIKALAGLNAFVADCWRENESQFSVGRSKYGS